MEAICARTAVAAATSRSARVQGSPLSASVKPSRTIIDRSNSWLQPTMHLATPHLIWESIAGGPASPVWRWLALTYRCMLRHNPVARP
jgi:hypothetical protein